MLQSIQICRAIAALLVVCYHSARNLDKERYFGPLADHLEQVVWFAGDAGVAFFFVLSGFIIHRVHASEFDQPGKVWPYLRKRILRIYPTYLVIFVAVFLLAKMTPSLRDTVPSNPYVLLKSLLLLPQDPKVVGGTGAPVLVVAWSLQYEMLFYLAFATAIVNRWILYALAALFVSNFAFDFIPWSTEFHRTFFSSHLMFLFGLGLLASKAEASRFRVPAVGSLALFSAVAFFLVGMVADSSRGHYFKPGFDLAYGLISAVLVFALARYEGADRIGFRRRFRTGRIAALGDSSYALYLIHFPLIAILSRLAVHSLPMTALGATVAFVFLVSASVVAAEIFHRFVERPLMRRLSPASVFHPVVLSSR